MPRKKSPDKEKRHETEKDETKSKILTDPEEIKKWTEERQGKPAKVKGTGGEDDPGLLRINFPGGAEASLEDISWEEFFEKFEMNDLAFLCQEKLKDGSQSRFFKLIKRED